jgi:hypothetical protein
MTQSSTAEQVQALERYKYGFVTEIESETAPRGLDENTVRFISAKKEEPDWLLDWRLRAYRAWMGMGEPNWAKILYPPIEYQDAYYYSAPKQRTKLESLDDVDPEILKTYEKLGIPLREQEVLAGLTNVAVDAVFDSVSVGDHLQEETGRGGRHLLLLLRGGAQSPRAGPQVSGLGGTLFRQLLRHAELGCVQRRLLRVRAEGRALPDGALHLFPHQCRADRDSSSAPSSSPRRGRM